MTSKFNNLPTDIFRSLLLYCNYKQLYVFFKISKKFSQLLKDNSFWVLYANSRGIPSTAYQSIVLNYLGHYDKSSLAYFDCFERIRWDTKLSPLTKSGIYTEFETVVRHSLTKEQRQKIFFKKDILIEVPFRGRPEKLSQKYNMKNRDRRKRKRFVLKTDTCVGSTLEHVFVEIYKNMYDLKDSELMKNLKDLSAELPDLGCTDDIRYSDGGKVYVLWIMYDEF